MRSWTTWGAALALTGCIQGGGGSGTRSLEGESCTRTADCVSGLRCVQLTCVDGGDAAPGVGGAGGQVGAGGLPGMGGTPGAGGAPGVGGAGGAPGAGGLPGMGGAPGAGGEPGVGGEPGAGGDPGGGGRPGFGGDPGPGGEPGFGGDPGPGGEPGFGGEPGGGGVPGGPLDPVCGVARPPAETPCDSACAWMADCMVCDAWCEGLGANDREAVEAGCIATCEATPALAVVLNNQNTCQETVAFIRGQSVDLDNDCRDDDPPREGDTDPAPAAWGGGARLTWADVPSDLAAADGFGCTVAGRNGGTGLASLFGLIGGGGLADALAPDAGGTVPWVLLGQFTNWRAGDTGNEQVEAALTLTDGGSQPDGPSFVGEQIAGSFPRADVRGGYLDATGATITLRPPLLGDFGLALRLEQASMRGNLEVLPAGFALNLGLIEGYLSRAALRDAVAAVLESCASPAPPESCDLIGGLLPPDDPDAGVELIVQLLGGFDARLQAGRPVACEGNACDLLSVCIAAEMRPTQVR